MTTVLAAQQKMTSVEKLPYLGLGPALQGAGQPAVESGRCERALLSVKQAALVRRLFGACLSLRLINNGPVAGHILHRLSYTITARKTRCSIAHAHTETHSCALREDRLSLSLGDKLENAQPAICAIDLVHGH